MKKPKYDENRRCPKCGKAENQINKGRNRSGTQRCWCKDCSIFYTPSPKKRAYSEEDRAMALKIYYSGVSGRGVGRIMDMNKNNVYNWNKKLNLLLCMKSWS
jgi:transposase-like protein